MAQLTDQLNTESHLTPLTVTDKLEELQKKLDSYKLSQKDYHVLIVEQVITTAEEHSWNICKNNNFIYVFNGVYWQDIEKEDFQNFLGEAAAKMGIKALTALHYQYREQLFKQFMATNYLPTPKGEQDVILINLKNGTFKITPTERILQKFDSIDFLTYQLPFSYDENNKAPLFQTYLDRVIPDKSLQAVLAEYIGYLFITNGVIKKEKVLLLYGTGANGKSVFFDIVNALVGSQNITNYTLQSLTNESGYQRAKIGNKLVNYASEISSKVDTAIFKQLISGEPVEARLPYGEPFTLKRYAKLIFNCNTLPEAKEHTHAYFRRLIIVPFETTIPEAEQDPDLSKKIIESELSGIFNWVLEGLDRLLKQRNFTECEIVKKQVDEYKIQSDPVSLFLNEKGYIKSGIEFEYLDSLYKDFITFCAADNCKVLTKSGFSSRLEALEYIKERKSAGMVFYIEKRGFELGT